MRTMLRDLRHAVLPNEHRDHQQQRAAADQPLQPEKRGGIHVAPTMIHAPQVHGDPRRDEYQRECKECRTAEKAADALDGELQTGNLSLLPVFESGKKLDILLRGGSQICRGSLGAFIACHGLPGMLVIGHGLTIPVPRLKIAAHRVATSIIWM